MVDGALAGPVCQLDCSSGGAAPRAALSLAATAEHQRANRRGRRPGLISPCTATPRSSPLARPGMVSYCTQHPLLTLCSKSPPAPCPRRRATALHQLTHKPHLHLFTQQTTSSRSKTLRGTTTKRCAPVPVAFLPRTSRADLPSPPPGLPLPLPLRRPLRDFEGPSHPPRPHSTFVELTGESTRMQAQLAKGEEVATCPSCSLLVRVVYDMVRPRGSCPFTGLSSVVLTNARACRWTTRTTTRRTRPSSRSPFPSSDERARGSIRGWALS